MSAGAAEFIVDSEIDAVDASPGDGLCAAATGECTLRAAVEEANALAGPDSVEVPAGNYVLSIATLEVTDGLTLTGGGVSATHISCAEAFRAFELVYWEFASPVASIRGLTIEGCGGGVLNDWRGTVLIEHVAFVNNSSRGIRIYPSAVETIVRYSTFSGNYTAYEGGAINQGGGDLLIEGSTFYGNYNVLEAGRGGAIRVYGSFTTATIVNSTFTENRSVTEAGAVHADIYATVNIQNCTFVDNESHFMSSDMGAYYDATITISNSILTGGCAGNVVSAGHNFFLTGTCALEGEGDLIGDDPQLGPLADNGGPTLTHAPISGSPVIDAGNDSMAVGSHDQRGPGYPRIIRGAVDMGAVEWGIVFRDSFEGR